MLKTSSHKKDPSLFKMKKNIYTCISLLKLLYNSIENINITRRSVIKFTSKTENTKVVDKILKDVKMC